MKQVTHILMFLNAWLLEIFALHTALKICADRFAVSTNFCDTIELPNYSKTVI